jgi:hypothetical protein
MPSGSVRLACEIIRRGVLTREELDAILRSGRAPREIVVAVREALGRVKGEAK